MPTRDRYDPARDIFTSNPDPDPDPVPPPVPPPPPATTTNRSPRPLSPPRHPAKSPLQSSPPSHENMPNDSSPSRKRKASPQRAGAAVPLTADNLPKIKRRRDSTTDRDRAPRRDRAPVENRYLYRSPPPSLIPLRKEEEDPTPRKPSPPRPRKRPGASSRLSEKEKEIARQRLEAREREEEAARNAESMQLARVEEKVRSHYNDKKELGKEWRQNSRIKGLRAFNNWVKSTLIQKFTPREDFDPRRPSADPNDHLVVLDMGCGKGGDLLKWKSAPQEVGFYLGVDSANISIIHARDRYNSMLADQRRGRRSRDGRKVFEAEFHAMDCWTTPLDTIPMARRIGYDPNVGPGIKNNPRFSPAGFDVVSMMFCMHYAFETEAKCRQMLRNVSGALKPGGRFIGTIPSSDVISERVRGKDKRDKLPENEEHGVQEWGNSIYRVKFSNPPPRSGTFRPYWGWEYNFFLEEAVEEVPEYVVPWEAFRGIAEDYGLELEYKKPFHNVWEEEKDQSELRVLSERMGVRRRDGSFALGDDEWEACGFYLAFSFRKEGL